MNRTANSATRAPILRASPLVSPARERQEEGRASPKQGRASPNGGLSGTAPTNLYLLQRFVPPLALFVLAIVFVGLYDPLHRPLSQDPGIFALLSQLVAQGLVPHRDAFNEQTSLTFFLGGGAMWLGNLVGVPPLVAFRLAAMAVLGGVAALTYVVGKFYSGSTWVGFVAGVILLGFQGYVLRTAQTLEPKSLMLIFGLASLYFLQKRSWFWAGALACAAALAWQVAGIYLMIAFLLAAMQGGILMQERGRALLRVGLAAGGVFGIYFLYFFLNHAHIEMLQQTFLAPSVMHNVTRTTMSARLERLVRTFYRGFDLHTGFAVLGALGLMLDFGTLAYAKKWQAIPLRVGDALLQNPRTAGVLLTTLAFVGTLFADFQNYPDAIPLLPFFSIFAALFLYRAVKFIMERAASVTTRQWIGWAAVALAVFSISTYETVSASRAGLRNTWQEQQVVAEELNRLIPADAPLWVLSKAELLFFMKRHNLNKYIYLLGRVDAASDAFDPGGFAGMMKDALAQKPVLYVLGRIKRGKFSTKANYDTVKKSTKGYVHLGRCRVIGGGAFYTLPAQAADWFAVEKKGCLTNPAPN